MSEAKNNNEMFDLGSEPVDIDFDPFPIDDELSGDTTEENAEIQVSDDNTVLEQPEMKPDVTVPDNVPDTSKETDAKKVKTESSFEDVPPVFEYAGAKENISDTSMTFDELRIDKAGDFPELDDVKKVSWTVEYGKITKTVIDPKGTSIGKMKSDIEASKEFTDSLKKAKDKNPVCKVKPRVTAQSKGTASAYRGVFTSLSEAESAGKVISIVPAKDGLVYEIRNTEMGRFITPTVGGELLSDVRAGFIPALPLIPMYMMTQIVTLFRHFAKYGNEHEVLVNLYFDKEDRTFIIDVPEQTVTKVSVNSTTNTDYTSDRFIHYMDIHSHNSMKAFFSGVDDTDEKATRLYTVIGRLYKYFPDIKTRISNGGKFMEINPALVFEQISSPIPDEWKERVRFKEAADEIRSGKAG